MSVQRIALIGMMGAGKTTIGTAISQVTGWRYIDNDELVEQITGLQTRELLEQRGEAAMRDAEFAAVDKVLAIEPPVVVGAAAGIVISSEVCERLRSGSFVVYLRASVETLISRVEGTHRPWLGADPEAAMRKLYEGREPKYEALAHLTIDVDEGTPEDAARQILDVAGDSSG